MQKVVLLMSLNWKMSVQFREFPKSILKDKNPKLKANIRMI